MNNVPRPEPGLPEPGLPEPGLHEPGLPEPGLPEPPAWAEGLLSALVPWQYRDEHIGDLREGFARRADDLPAARHWYLRHVLRSIPGALRLRLQARHDHDSHRDLFMATLLQDLAYGLRALRKSPGFALVSTLTLALAIGVNTSVFSLVSALVFADLPMQETATVSVVRGTNTELGVDRNSVSPADYLDLLERSRSFESLSALTEAGWVLTGADEPQRVIGLRVSAGITETWRLPPVLGRGFMAGEDVEGAPSVAMLAYGFWQTQFGERLDVLGETVRLDGIEHTIVGVMSPKLAFASFASAQILTPLVLPAASADRGARTLFVSGRLAPGVTQEMAAAEVRQIGEQLAAEFPVENTGWGLWSAPVMESLLNQEANTILLLLQLTVGMVILIACANVANMLLARATARAREIAVRSALGAGRPRLIRQLLTESLMISLAAAGLGILFAKGLNEAMIWISAGTEPAFLMAKLNTRVLLFTLSVSLVAPLAFGLFPALRASASGPAGALRDGRSGDGGRSGKRARSALVTAQVALALTLMIVATLMTRTVINLNSRPLGFDPHGIVTVAISLPQTSYGDAAAYRAFFPMASEAVAGLLPSGRVEMVSTLPGLGFGSFRTFAIEGREVIEGAAPPSAQTVTASSGYFDMVGLPIIRGRAYDSRDRAESPMVAIVSQELADRHWPGENPVGRRIRFAGVDAWHEIIGIAADVRSATDTERPALNLYLAFDQDPRASMVLVGRSEQDALNLAGPVRQAIWNVDADLPVGRVQTLERAQYESAASSFALVALFGTFAFFALAMAALGIYGVMSYSVSQRRSEIGLRMALGAEAHAVRMLIVGQGTRLVAVGIGVGLLAAFAISRLIASILFGISATDAIAFVGMPLVLGLVAIVANFVPALRATSADPATTLRAD